MFQYTPLSANDNEFRLLKLGPKHGQDNETRCTIIHTAHDAAPDYQALSYTWGEDVRQGPAIFINNCRFLVRPNLHSALAQLESSHFKSRYLWIDAICINQDDAWEKNSQVRKMKTIFQNASRVLVWLGPSSSTSRDAFDVLNELDNLPSPEQVQSLIRDPERRKDWEALINLFKRPYWRRVWVIQEVQFAKTITVLCGNDSIEWANLLKSQGMLWNEHAAALNTLALTTKSLRNIPFWIRGRGARGLDKVPVSPQGDLFRTLLFHRLKEATDPRDKVFSLLGLTNVVNEIEIDYRRDIRQIYIDTATFVIRKTGKLDIVWAVPPHQGQHNIPSWVPDWSINEEKQADLSWALQETKLEFVYHASEERVAAATVDREKGILRAMGIIITRIKYIGDITHMVQAKDIRQAIVAVHAWRRLVEDRLGGDSVLLSTFMETLRCGRMRLEASDPYETLQEKNLDILANFDGLRTEADIKALRESLDPHHVKNSAEIDELAQLIFRRRFFLSSDGIMGLAPEQAKAKDLVCVLLGCSVPVVLRADREFQTYVGDAYVDGYMSGKAVLEDGDAKHEIIDFEIH